MTMGTMTLFDKVKEYIGDGTIDLDGDTFKAAIVTSTGAVDVTDDVWADLSGNIAANIAAITLTNVTWIESSGVVTFDCDPLVFTASGGNGTGRHVVIYDDTVTTPIADPLVCFALLDVTPADKTILSGDTLTLTPPTDGLFQSS